MRRRVMLLLAATIPAVGHAQSPSEALTAATVFAAASLQEGLKALAVDWQGQGHLAPRLVFAASSTLARQLEQGAPADLFLSADTDWMDWAQQRGLILTASRREVLGNELVLIAPADSPLAPQTLAPGSDLLTLLGPRGRLALGDPAHVPAGIYAAAALRWLGQWTQLMPRLARGESVRSALLLVERGEVPLGIVYATDALAARVVVVGRFPASSHPAIRYPFALTSRAAGQAEPAALLAFLSGPTAAATWRRFGFSQT